MDPYSSFMFYVEIKGITVAQFSEVNGLQIEIETESYREGGENGFVYNFPKGVKYQPLVLKRGIADIDELWDWYKRVIDCFVKKTDPNNNNNNKTFQIERKDVTIRMYKSPQDMRCKEPKLRSWTFQSAYPIKWTGPVLKADSSNIAFESIELVHQGIAGSNKNSQ